MILKDNSKVKKMARTKIQIRKDYEDLDPKIQADFNNLLEKLQKSMTITKELSTLRDDSQLLKLDLQDKLQKLQQVIQTMSNIMKSQHDILKAIMGNLKA